ncbi:MAG: hypothetical protein AAB638_02990 [Patescibacteria group bacterium]
MNKKPVAQQLQLVQHAGGRYGLRIKPVTKPGDPVQLGRVHYLPERGQGRVRLFIELDVQYSNDQDEMQKAGTFVMAKMRKKFPELEIQQVQSLW